MQVKKKPRKSARTCEAFLTAIKPKGACARFRP
jgi:hypothetical protein